MDEVEEAVTRLRLIVRTLERRAQAETGEGSPTRSQQAILAWLRDRGDLSPSALAAAERLRPQSVGELVDTLERRGWVARRPEPGDRRRVLVSLTDSGAEALERGRRLRQAWLGEAMRTRLDAEERRRLIAALELLERVVFDDRSAGPAGE